MSVDLNGTIVIIIQVYAPTESSTEEELENFYDLLDDTLSNYKARRTMVMGDFNSKIGSKEFEKEE